MLLFETLSVVWTEAGGRTSELESLTFNPKEFPSDLTRFRRSSSSNCESIWAKISLDLSLLNNCPNSMWALILSMSIKGHCFFGSSLEEISSGNSG